MLNINNLHLRPPPVKPGKTCLLYSSTDSYTLVAWSLLSIESLRFCRRQFVNNYCPIIKAPFAWFTAAGTERQYYANHEMGQEGVYIG
jgi:hypothetical protein